MRHPEYPLPPLRWWERERDYRRINACPYGKLCEEDELHPALVASVVTRAGEVIGSRHSLERLVPLAVEACLDDFRIFSMSAVLFQRYVEEVTKCLIDVLSEKRAA